MQEEIKRAIEVLTKQIKDGVGPDDALKLSQAALNLAHCDATGTWPIAMRQRGFRTDKTSDRHDDG